MALDLEALQSKTMADMNRGCWLWTGHLDKSGYGIIRQNGKNVRAHRLSYELFHGEKLNDHLACHHCDMPGCINPAHLYAGDHRSNARDMFERGRATHKGECNPKAKLTTEVVEEIRRKLSLPLSGGRRRRLRGSIAALAREYGVFRSTIHKIAAGKVWV